MKLIQLIFHCIGNPSDTLHIAHSHCLWDCLLYKIKIFAKIISIFDIARISASTSLSVWRRTFFKSKLFFGAMPHHNNTTRNHDKPIIFPFAQTNHIAIVGPNDVCCSMNDKYLSSKCNRSKCYRIFGTHLLMCIFVYFLILVRSTTATRYFFCLFFTFL